MSFSIADIGAILKQNKHQPLDHKKRCDLCGSVEYNLFPYTLHVCKGCAEQIYSNNRNAIRYMDWELYMHGEYCDICGRKTYKLWNANINLCINCTEHLWVNNRRKHLESD